MGASPITQDDLIRAFSRFRLNVTRRILMDGSQPLPLRTRELDILILLVERAGTFITKEELTERIWGNPNVSEANVRVQIAGLRRILGDGRDKTRYIVNVTGKGYSFCAPLHSGERPLSSETPVPPLQSAPRRHNLPIRLKPTLGRGEAILRLTSQLPLKRLMTVVGPGGMGKTTVALTAVEDLTDAYEDGVRFVDLADISDERLVPSAIASALGLADMPDPIEGLIRQLEGKQILLLLDNCEHVIDSTAMLVGRILSHTRGVHFLTTSREPLRIDGEWLFRLGPLDIPPSMAALTASEIQAYPAVKLFVDRARLSDSRFELQDGDAPAVTELCRRLDGNPLALELAAARVGLFGIRGLAEQLDETFNMLNQGSRTALPRHQTLRATLDWSYEILPAPEQNLLRCLSVFRGEFILDAAFAVASRETGDDLRIMEGLAGLTSKSLVNADITKQPAHYRMLFLTRDYAFEKLQAGGEYDDAARRHAQLVLKLFQSGGNEGEPGVDDVRAAINWAMSPGGDGLLGAELTLTSVDFGVRHSLLHEYGRHIDNALTFIAAEAVPQPRLEMQLAIERCNILQHTSGDLTRMQALTELAHDRARAVCQDSGSPEELIDVLSMTCGIQYAVGHGPGILKAASRLTEVSSRSRDLSATLLATRLMAQARHFMGDHLQARALVESFLGYPEATILNRRYMAGDRANPLITMRILLARILWITGKPQSASKVAAEAVEMAETSSFVQCYALAFAAIPIAIWRGDLDTGKAYLAKLLPLCSDLSLGFWEDWGTELRRVVSALETGASFQYRRSGAQAVLRNDLISALDARFLAPETVERVHDGLVGWNAPEVLRASAMQALTTGGITEAEAQTRLQTAMDMARRQAALGWELRIATNLAGLWRKDGRAAEGARLLGDLLLRFTEGAGDLDLCTAIALRAELSNHPELSRAAEISNTDDPYTVFNAFRQKE